MRTLALRGGERVAVAAAEWRYAFGVVTRGRVQLELRNGEPGPVLTRNASFWLHGTGVRALRNPGHRTASVRIATPRATERSNAMTNTNDTEVSARPAPAQTSYTHRLRKLTGTGIIATLVAATVTTLAAALAQAIGIAYEIPENGETIPLTGFAVVTAFFSVVGLVIAAALLRWSTHPAKRFMWTAVTLTAISLAPPFISGAASATIATLLGLHLIAAAVMIPALTRSLNRAEEGSARP